MEKNYNSLNVSNQIIEMGTDYEIAWRDFIESMGNDTDVLIVRGAGQTGGIPPEAIGPTLKHLMQRITERQLLGRRLTVLFDGDPSRYPHRPKAMVPNDYTGRREGPDTGSLMSELVHQLSGSEDQGACRVIGVQQKEWHLSKFTDGDMLRTSYGEPIQTVLFEKMEGVSHQEFTQSLDLLQRPATEMMFIGAIGGVGAMQFADLVHKTHDRSGRPLPVTMVRVHNDPAVEDTLVWDELHPANPSEIARVHDLRMKCAERPYGVFFDKNGTLDVLPHPGIEIHTVIIPDTTT